MHQSQLSDVQVTNLTLLLTIRDAVHRDPVVACSKFEIDSAQAERIGTMTVPQIIALVANVGDATLFLARRDLLALLDAPLPLTRPLAAVRATRYLAA